MNDDLAKTLFRAGCFLRGSRVLQYLEELRESDLWSEERLFELQAERLRSLLVHARDHSPFYRRLFAEHGIDCARVAPADITRIPPLDKKRLAAERADIQNDGGGGRLIYSRTAGTSSVPLLFYRTAEWDARHRAAIMRGLGWYGVEPWMANGYLLAPPPRPVDRMMTRLEDILLNRFRPRRLERSAAVLEPFYRKLARARYLSGFSHMLYELAHFVNEAHPGDALHHLLVVKGTSEKVMPFYQDTARRAFGSPIRSEYGAAEAGIIAFECPSGTLHVNMEHVIVEEEGGEIVVTNLLSHSFPFIRYRLGDYVKLRRGAACPCGRRRLVVEDIMGRVGMRVIGSKGEIFPSISVDQIIKRLVTLGKFVVQCQAVQRTAGRIEFHTVLASPLDRESREAVERFFAEIMPKYFGEAVGFTVRFVDAIPRTDRKFLEFVSELPQDESMKP